ncbi:hypothetical protein [Streptomyces sp. NPDC017520]|uniref:hypothetical protein n=1 Tax=Streptomyces sp. NPDC017520 TaxID=3364998 RepID=UPI0037920E86
MLLFDGVFLLRPELVDRWDLSIFMSATFERTLDRARTRGEALAGRAASTTEEKKGRKSTRRLRGHAADGHPASTGNAAKSASSRPRH